MRCIRGNHVLGIVQPFEHEDFVVAAVMAMKAATMCRCHHMPMLWFDSYPDSIVARSFPESKCAAQVLDNVILNNEQVSWSAMHYMSQTPRRGTDS